MVVPSLIAAGMEVMVAELCRRLRERGHRPGVTCLLSEGSLAHELAGDGIPVREVKAPGRWGNIHPAGLAAVFQHDRLDIVHIHSGIWLKAARAARLARIKPIIYTAHGLPEPNTRLSTMVGHFAGRSTDIAVGVSSSVCDFLTDRARLPRSKVVLIRNGIDTSRFCPEGPKSGLREEIGAASLCCVVGIVARLAFIKDHQTLIHAFSRTASTRPYTRLVIIGDGPLLAELKAQVQTLGLEAQVHFLGERRNMAAVYRDLDIVALSSISEGTSLSLLEGLASGCACIATAVGGNPEVLGGGNAGILVPARSPELFAAALGSLIDDHTRRRELGQRGRAWVENMYGQAAMTDAYEDLYRTAEPVLQPAGAR